MILILSVVEEHSVLVCKHLSAKALDLASDVLSQSTKCAVDRQRQAL